MPRNPSNPDRDFSADQRESEAQDMIRRNEMDDLFDDPVVRERMVKMIAQAMRGSLKAGW
jgi:hypothetical protein